MRGQTNAFIRQHQLQRHLRSNMTEAEKAVWRMLRGGQMSGYRFRRQHPFGDYILDFVSLSARLVIEIDGGQHAEQVAADNQRDQFLRDAGFRVLRFWNNQVLTETEAVREAIWQSLQASPSK